MYSYTSATLAIRAKCSLSYYHISPPNDQSCCCYPPCCHFPANRFFPVIPRVIAAPSPTLVSCRRRFVRVFPRSRCSEMMELLSEPEVRFQGLEGKGWKGGRKEVEIKSTEGKRQMCDGSSSVVSTSSTSLRDCELNGTGRRRVGGVSIVGNGDSKKGTKFGADAAKEEAREVQKYVDDSWQGKRHSSKRDVVVNSIKDDSMKENDCLRQLGVKDGHENVGRWANLSQKENHRGNGLYKGSQKVTRISEVQSDIVKKTSVSANVRGTEKGESSVSGAREYSDTYQVVRHDEPRRSYEKQLKMADFHNANNQTATYTHRGFQGTTIREREEQKNLEKNSAQLAHDKRIHFDRHAIEQDESARRTQRLREVSVFPSSDFEKASDADDKSAFGMEVRANSVWDSDQVVRKKMTQISLQRPVESKSYMRDEKLPMEENSLQLRISEGNKRVQELDEARRNTEMLSEVSKVRSCNLKSLSLFEGRRITEMESNSNFIQSSVPFTKDKGIQVEVHEANHDQIEVSRFNANNILNPTSLWSPPESRVDPKEYNTHLNLNQVSSLKEQFSQANEEGYLQSAGLESESDTNEFDLTRRNTRRISSLQENYNSRIESKNEKSSARTSVLLTQEEKEMQKSSLTEYSSKFASMQITSTGCFHDISSSQPTYIEAGQVPQSTDDSAPKSDKSSVSRVTEFVGKRQKEIVEMNESGKISNFSSGIQIGEPGRRDIQETLRIGNKKETFATVLTEDRVERGSSFLGESSQSKSMRMDSGSSDGILSSLKTHVGVDYNSDRDAINQITNDAIESAKQFDKYSAFHAGEFADKIQQELLSLKMSGMEPNISSGVQTEGTVRRESQVTASMQAGGLNESKSYGDGRYTTEGGRLSQSELGLKGPSAEMWDVQGPSTREVLNDKGPEVDSATSEAVVLTTPRRETAAIIRRSPKSMWSYVTDIIRMSWVLRGHSHNSTLASNRRASSNDSLSSDTWFSGHEPDEVAVRDETQNEEKISLLKESVPVEESVEHLFEEQKNGYRLAMSEQSSSNSSGLISKGSSAQTSSSSIEAIHKEGAKSSRGTVSSVSIVEQRLALEADATLRCTTDMVESSIRDNVKVLKPSSSFPVAMIKKGFSSSITQATDVLESAQVWGSGKSGLEILEQPSVSTIDSVLPRITEVAEVNMSGSSIPKSELVPSSEKLLEIGGIMEPDIKGRKFQRNNQVIKEQFDEWEEAFKLENEQRRFDENFMKEAILEAWKGADTWEVPVGAVLVQNGKIIARGCNMVEELRDSTAHAEMICIREASKLLRTWRLAETTLYVTLEPCPMCAGAILQSRIDTVVWGAPNKLLGADGSWVRLFPGGGDGGTSNMDPPTQMVGPVHPFHPKIKIRRGVLANECSDVMQQFFKLRRKKDKRPESSSSPSHLSISNRPAKLFTKLHNIFCMVFCL